MSTDQELARANCDLSFKILKDFNRNMEGWFDHFHDDLVVEFAFASSGNIPSQTVGKVANTALFTAIVEDVRVQFYDIRAQSLADPAKVVVEYKGRGGTGKVPYEQTYICMQTFKEGKLIEFREYFDTWVVNKSFETLDTLHV